MSMETMPSWFARPLASRRNVYKRFLRHMPLPIRLNCPAPFTLRKAAALLITIRCKNVTSLLPSIKQHTDWLMNLSLCPTLCLPPRNQLYLKISSLIWSQHLKNRRPSIHRSPLQLIRRPQPLLCSPLLCRHSRRESTMVEDVLRPRLWNWQKSFRNGCISASSEIPYISGATGCIAPWTDLH